MVTNLKSKAPLVETMLMFKSRNRKGLICGNYLNESTGEFPIRDILWDF
jgi:hypothetical protein